MVCQHQWFWSENQSAPSDPREVTPAGGSWWIIPLQQALDSFIYVIIIMALCRFRRKSFQLGQTRLKPQCSRHVCLPESGSLEPWKDRLVNLITIWRIISSPVCTCVLLLVKQPAGCGHWWQPDTDEQPRLWSGFPSLFLLPLCFRYPSRPSFWSHPPVVTVTKRLNLNLNGPSAVFLFVCFFLGGEQPNKPARY